MNHGSVVTHIGPYDPYAFPPQPPVHSSTPLPAHSTIATPLPAYSSYPPVHHPAPGVQYVPSCYPPAEYLHNSSYSLPPPPPPMYRYVTGPPMVNYPMPSACSTSGHVQWIQHPANQAPGVLRSTHYHTGGIPHAGSPLSQSSSSEDSGRSTNLAKSAVLNSVKSKAIAKSGTRSSSKTEDEETKSGANRAYKKRIRSAKREELTLVSAEKIAPDCPFEKRRWRNNENHTFYDCSCGARRPTHDGKRITSHIKHVHVAVSNNQ
eukprot:TRINITY_DN64463_c0_g1_i1.p1 TRINITY_DN64463_c0_g1~~TRINITY_DN64463_c0_g1_i1.p1  ORF type:complete len:263 (+),score=17.22 TRINITY_DN64463_c0_g1_i1:45-833(+)